MRNKAKTNWEQSRILVSCFAFIASIFLILPVYALTPIEPEPFVPGSFTIIAIPDSQYAMDGGPLEKYTDQIQWILDNKVARNIALVMTLGDDTNNNNQLEWERFKYGRSLNSGETTSGQSDNSSADDSVGAPGMLSIIDAGIPVGIVLGNHDYSDTANRIDSMFEQFFPDPLLEQNAANGNNNWGYYPDALDAESRDNYYHTFSAGGKNWIQFNLEFGVRDKVLNWANRVIEGYPDHYAILGTHAYMYRESSQPTRGKRYSNVSQSWWPHSYSFANNDGYEGNDGQEMWDKLIRQHGNFVLTLSGHVNHGDSFGRVAGKGEQGNTVHEMLSDYQTCWRQYCGIEGSSSYLRMLEFQPDGITIRVKTYSPYLGLWMEDEDNHFTLAMHNTVIKTAPIESIAINPSSSAMKQGQVKSLAAIATFADGSTSDVTYSVIWSSANDSIATINTASAKGEVVAVSIGETTITATRDNVSARVIINIRDH
jgi:Bacterial Ig-like domain (group 2)